MSTMEEELLNQLETVVLAPLDKIEAGTAKQIRGWIEEHMAEEPIIKFMSARSKYDVVTKDSAGKDVTRYEEGIVEYRLGQETPVAPGRTIFGMFLFEEMHAVVVYSFDLVADETNGEQGARYFKEIVKSWDFIDCQMSGEAMIAEMEWALDPEDQKPGAQRRPTLNGHARG